MSDIVSGITSNIHHIIAVIITGVISYVGLQIKKTYQEFINDKQIKEIVDKTVKYVEQIGVNLSCEEKKKYGIKKVIRMDTKQKVKCK